MNTLNSWTVNPDMSLTVLHVGQELTPVIVIDDYLKDPTALIAGAAEAQFSKSENSGYPGVRAPLPDTFIAQLIEKMVPVIRDVYRVPDEFIPGRNYGLYSLVTTPPEKLAVLQRVPHFDTKRPYYFALMCYLNEGDFGGTGLFRHQPSGFERITEERFYDYVISAEQFMAKNGLPEEVYCRGDDGHYGLIAEIAYKPNRLVIYPGSLLHSSLIEHPRDTLSDPASGRLTANVFLDFSCG